MSMEAFSREQLASQRRTSLTCNLVPTVRMVFDRMAYLVSDPD